MKINIVIPTYNRVDLLRGWFIAHEYLLNTKYVDVYVSDNASTDGTSLFIEEIQQKASNVHHSRLAQTVKAAYNFEIALNLPPGGVVWMVGDSYHIEPLVFEKIRESLDPCVDFIVVNFQERSLQPAKRNISAIADIAGITGVLSCISCVIYNRDRLGKIEFETKSWSYYSHMLYVLNMVVSSQSILRYESDVSVKMLSSVENRKNWANTTKVFEIGLENWVVSVGSVDWGSRTALAIASKEFGQISGLFKLRGLFWLRAQGLYTLTTYSAYRRYFDVVIPNSDCLLRLIAIMPVTPLRLLVKLIGKKID